MTTCNILQIKAQNDHLQHLITSEGVVLEQNNTSMTPIKIKNEDAIFRPSTRFPEKSTLPPEKSNWFTEKSTWENGVDFSGT